MTNTHPENLEADVAQHVRDDYARQLRSDYLASLFKIFFDTARERFTHSVSEMRVNTEA